jgi:hypothetical protein
VLFPILKAFALTLALIVFAFAIVLNVVNAIGAALAVAFADIIDNNLLGFGTAIDLWANAQLMSQKVFLSAILGLANDFASIGLDVGEDVRKGLSRAIGKIDKEIETGNPAQEMADKLRAMAQDFSDASPDLEEMAAAISELAGLTLEEADIKADGLQRQKEINEELSNIPSGFKVNLARFRSTIAGLGRPPLGQESAAGVGRNIIIETLIIQSDDPTATAQAIEDEANRRAAQQTGTPFGKDVGQVNNGNN